MVACLNGRCHTGIDTFGAALWHSNPNVMYRWACEGCPLAIRAHRAFWSALGQSPRLWPRAEDPALADAVHHVDIDDLAVCGTDSSNRVPSDTELHMHIYIRTCAGTCMLCMYMCQVCTVLCKESDVSSKLLCGGARTSRSTVGGAETGTTLLYLRKYSR